MFEQILQSMFFALWPVTLAFCLGALLEWLRPWRREYMDRLRWLHAGILFFFTVVLLETVMPINDVEASLLSDERHWGLLGYLDVPYWIKVVIGVLILDLSYWVSHWALHQSSVLWRMHRLHHSDEVLDVSSSFRFHPAESVFRFFIQIAVILVVGIPIVAIVITFALALSSTVWAHTNIPTPRVMRPLAWIVIIPDLHRIHHGTEERFQQSNLGTIFSLWDRLFGTYIPDIELNNNTQFGLGPENQLRFDTLADVFLDPLRNTDP